MSKRIHVLIIDDDRDQRAALREILERRNVRVSEAASGRQAFAYLLDVDPEPDFLLLDLNMPDMDGNTLLQLLAAHTRLSMIPVVVISGDHAPALKQPVARRLMKPVTESALLRTITEVMGVAA